MTGNDPNIDPVEASPELASALSGMSRWDGPADAWRAALAEARPARSVWSRKLPSKVMAVAAVLMIGVLLIGLILPSMGKARSSARMPTVSASPKAAALDYSTSGFMKQPEPSQATMFSGRAGVLNEPSDRDVALVAGASSARAAPGRAAGAAPPDRQVIRKANIDLKARDVRATFLKAAQVLSEAQGEYIEQSSLTGQDEYIQGSLTLRVSAERLSEVLNQLRGLADVTSESSGGEDVTNQVVDLEARLHNEQRVETELLGLMESRKDAPLKEILELRDSISRVRENIERMTAQRERLGRLVSLATVLVIINPDSTKPAPLPEGMGTYFLKEVRMAWQSSIELLVDSLGFLIRVFIGGAFFWLMGASVIIGVIALRRKSLRARTNEPAPRLG
jgi:hypothetical protein